MQTLNLIAAMTAAITWLATGDCSVSYLMCR